MVPGGAGSRGGCWRGGLSLNARVAEHDLLQTERGPERRCVVTGAAGRKTALLRFVVGPGDVIVPDVTGRLPGRGIWLCAARETVDAAVKKRLFARAARAAVSVPLTLADDVERLLLRQLQNALGLAYKAGAAVPGFAKTEALLEKGRCCALMEARDAGPHGAAKLRGRAARSGIPVIASLTAEEMGLALGRASMVHAGLSVERLGLRVLEEARRLAGFRPSPPEQTIPAPESEET